MSETLEWLTRGNVTEVKIVLASLVAASALYQVLLMAVGYRKVTLSFLSPESASKAHRTIGDMIVVLTILVALVCISYFEVDDDNFVHSTLGVLLLLVLFVKVAVVRRWVRADGALPVLGITLCLLFLATWLSSAAGYLEF